MCVRARMCVCVCDVFQYENNYLAQRMTVGLRPTNLSTICSRAIPNCSWLTKRQLPSACPCVQSSITREGCVVHPHQRHRRQALGDQTRRREAPWREPNATMTSVGVGKLGLGGVFDDRLIIVPCLCGIVEL